MTIQTYGSYLKTEELLSLQQPQSDEPEHDEMLFIIIHQVYELWFKQQLHELELLREALLNDRIGTVNATFHRILRILKTMVAQIDVLETMTPVSFNSFRDRLDSASGFQSVQFREVELFLGHRRPAALAMAPKGSLERARLSARMAEPSLYEAFLRFLMLRGYEIPAAAVERDRTLPPVEDERVRAILVRIYKDDSHCRQVCEQMVDLDEGLQEWRYRHVKMVERTIGTKRGTGGSAGVEYLKSTLFASLFPDLWAIRAEL